MAGTALQLQPNEVDILSPTSTPISTSSSSSYRPLFIPCSPHGRNDNGTCFLLDGSDFSCELLINMFRDIFNMYDKDGNNSIDSGELKLILEELGYECTEDDVSQVIKKFDTDQTGTIDFNEFLCLIGDWMSNDENQIRDAFEVFDKEGNGYLSLEQLKRALTTYGEAFTDTEAEEFFSEIDIDGDGTITADEFIQYIKGLN